MIKATAKDFTQRTQRKTEYTERDESDITAETQRTQRKATMHSQEWLCHGNGARDVAVVERRSGDWRSQGDEGGSETRRYRQRLSV